MLRNSRRDAAQSNSQFKGIEAVRWRKDRAVDSQDTEAIAIVSTIVFDREWRMARVASQGISAGFEVANEISRLLIAV